MGFFDGRGHFHLVRRPLVIDADVPGVVAQVRSRRTRLDSGALLDVALAVLNGDARGGVRAAAELIGRSPGTVSKLLGLLRDEHLVTAEGVPAIPDLFNVVLEDWQPDRVPLADMPRPGMGSVNRRLKVGLEDVDQPGWVLADAHAAAAWGAPVVLSGDAAPDFYVPDALILQQARVLLGEAAFGRHACTVAVAPAPTVCRRRYDRATEHDQVFFAPAPVVAALDLAADPARGRETLETWSLDLPLEIHRVW
jgi:hypothetical protein